MTLMYATSVESGLLSFLLTLDGLIYNLIRYIYNIFLFLAKLNLFSEEDYMEIVGKIYIILGVVMLFVLAYSLLRAIINPDDFAKGEYSFPNIIKNVIISIIIIAVLPTVFTVAFNIQAAVLNSDVIAKIILSNTGAGDTSIADGGNTIAYNVFRAFFQPNEDFCKEKNLYSTDKQCAILISQNKKMAFWQKRLSLSEVDTNVLESKASFTNYASFSNAAADGDITYTYIISTIVGVLVGAILLSYCIDMGVRVVKLLFFQIIAPVPVICRILPGEKKKIFDNWLKQTTTTFFEVFIRVAILYLGVYLITRVVKAFDDMKSISGIGLLQSPSERLFALVFIIVGIILFIRSAPKLIKDLFGIELGGSTLTRLFGMGAAVGGGITAASRNFFNGMHDNRGFVRSMISAASGFGSGAARSAWNARNAKNLGDMRNAASTGATGATTARSRRDSYRDEHRVNIPIIGGLVGAGVGHLRDTVAAVGRWSGATDNVQKLQAEKDFYAQLTAIDDNTDSTAVKLLDRDAIKRSASLMAAAGGPNMSLSVMKRLLKDNANRSFDQVRGKILRDLDGNNFLIRTEADYAAFNDRMQARVDESERNLKRYLKEQGCQGAAGVSNIERYLTRDGLTLGTTERQHFAKIYSDQENMSNLVRENRAQIESLNRNLTTDHPGTVTVNEIASYTDMNTLIDNVKQRNIDISADMERLIRLQGNNNNNNNGNTGGH